MKNINGMTYYHGTSTIYDVGTYLTPITKIDKDERKLTYKNTFAKVFVTANIDAAKFYAKREAQNRGGSPIIYIVKPDMHSLIKVNKTDFVTSGAEVLGVYNEDDND